MVREISEIVGDCEWVSSWDFSMITGGAWDFDNLEPTFLLKMLSNTKWKEESFQNINMDLIL